MLTVLFDFTLSTDDMSTSWASDAIPKRRNQTYTNRMAEVCLVAWIRTRRVAHSGVLHWMKLEFRGRTLWLLVLRVILEWPSSCLRPNVAGFLDAVEEAADVKTAPFLSASMIRDATAADSRARARNGSGREIAAPLSLLLFTSAHGR